MAESVLGTVIAEYITRRNDLTLEISNLSDQKRLLASSQAENQVLLSSKKSECRAKWKAEFKNNETEYKNTYKYADYTEIPDFDEEMDRITTEIQAEIDELTAKETDIDAQITTDDTELTEVESWLDSYKEMLSGNISEDYDYGLS